MKIKKSPNLDKATEDASAILLNRKNGDEESAYRNFYKELCATSPHGEMIKEQGLPFEEMVEISKNLREFGYSLEKYFYLPIHAFCRLKSFQHILAHREELRGLKGHDAFVQAALGLKKYYREMMAGAFFPG